jgi:hypothetical protein
MHSIHTLRDSGGPDGFAAVVESKLKSATVMGQRVLAEPGALTLFSFLVKRF